MDETIVLAFDKSIVKNGRILNFKETYEELLTENSEFYMDYNDDSIYNNKDCTQYKYEFCPGEGLYITLAKFKNHYFEEVENVLYFAKMLSVKDLIKLSSIL